MITPIWILLVRLGTLYRLAVAISCSIIYPLLFTVIQSMQMISPSALCTASNPL